MELVDIDVIGVEGGEGGLEVLLHTLQRCAHRLCCYIYLVPYSLQGKAEFVFAVRICTGGIEKGYTVVIGLSYKIYSVLSADTLDWEGAEAVSAYCDFCFSESYFVHISMMFTLFWICNKIVGL